MLAVGLGYLPYKAYGPGGISHIHKLEHQYNGLQRKNSELLRDNHSLRLRIEGLRDDRRAVERVARDELGLVRPTDVIFMFE